MPVRSYWAFSLSPLVKNLNYVHLPPTYFFRLQYINIFFLKKNKLNFFNILIFFWFINFVFIVREMADPEMKIYVGHVLHNFDPQFINCFLFKLSLIRQIKNMTKLIQLVLQKKHLKWMLVAHDSIRVTLFPIEQLSSLSMTVPYHHISCEDQV